MKKQSLQSRPPKINKELDAFIQGAGVKKEKSINFSSSITSISEKEPITICNEIIEVFPWEESHVRSDVKKLFALRLTEPEMLKLQFIQKKTERSMQKFCLACIIPAIEAEVNRLIEAK